MSSRLRILNISHVLPDQDRAAAYSPPLPLPEDGLVELSFMEALFVDRDMPMRRLFFYEGPGVPPFPRLVRSLQSSLAVELAVFPPLSGKLAHRPSAAGGGDVVVDCSPAAVSPGVRFVEAEYDGGIEDMRRVAGGGSSDEGDREALMELGPELDATRLPAPVLAVQVTRPAVGRTAVVAVALHHAAADGHSAWQFMRAWAALSRMGVSPSRAVPDLAPPVFDRTPLQYPEGKELARKILRTVAPALPVISSSSPSLPPDRLRRTFLIHAGEIQSVKQHIQAQRQTTSEQADKPPSTYLAVSSLVWTSVARAKFRDLAVGGDAYFMVAVDFRRRLGPPIDERYFGDCVVPCVARAAADDLLDGGGGLACAAAAIRDAIRAQPECPVRAMEAWLESLRALPRVRERFTFTGSSNRFMAYETDFGWGAPSRVELVSLFATELVLLLGAQNGGVQVTATLRPEHMEAFASNLGRFSAVGCGLDGSQLPRGRTANEIPSTPASAPWSPCPPASPPAGEPRAGKRGQKQDATPE